jgi:hypothetical protein
MLADQVSTSGPICGAAAGGGRNTTSVSMSPVRAEYLHTGSRLVFIDASAFQSSVRGCSQSQVDGKRPTVDRRSGLARELGIRVRFLDKYPQPVPIRARGNLDETPFADRLPSGSGHTSLLHKDSRPQNSSLRRVRRCARWRDTAADAVGNLEAARPRMNGGRQR